MQDKNKQFLKLSIQEEKHYSFLINLKKKIHQPVKELYQLDIIDKKTYDKLCPVGSHSGPKTRFEFGRRYKFIKSLEHHKRQKILQTDRSFAFCFILSLDKYALLQKTSFFIGTTFFKYGPYNKKHGIFIYNFCFQRFLTIQTS